MSHVIDKLALIYIQDKKLLVTLSKGKDTWYIPGGKREEGESDARALARETQEELSVELVPDTIEYFGTFIAPAHGQVSGVEVQMTCYFAEFEGQLQPANEIETFEFFSYADKHKTSAVDHLIFDDLKQKGMIE